MTDDAPAKPAALVVGGTSGLGLELALRLAPAYDVTVTGRHDPGNPEIGYARLDLGPKHLMAERLDRLLDAVPRTDLFVYAAGYFQKGTLDQLDDDDIIEMTNVGFLVPALLLRRILRRQGSLPGFIAVTSTSQWTPRLLEPAYTGVKAGLGMLANSVSLDERVRKTLVAGPAGMRTPFWDGTGHDTSTMLDPAWVAEQTLRLYDETQKYTYARILREPPRVEVVEKR